jgi:uncharacterized protein
MKFAQLKFVLLALALALSAPLVSYAAESDNRPSEQSVRELLSLMQTHNILESVIAQTNNEAVNAISTASEGKALTEEQKRVLTESRSRAMELVRQHLNWETLEPMVIGAYRDTFTQQEIDGMLKFYRSPSGQAVVAKMPQVMQRMMVQMQGQIQTLAPKLAELRRQTEAELQAAPKNGESPNR